MVTKHRTGYGKLRVTVGHVPDYIRTDALQHFQTIVLFRRTSHGLQKAMKIGIVVAHAMVAYSRHLRGHFRNVESEVLTRTM